MRRVLLLGALTATALAGCGDSGTTSTSTAGSTAASTSTTSSARGSTSGGTSSGTSSGTSGATTGTVAGGSSGSSASSSGSTASTGGTIGGSASSGSTSGSGSRSSSSSGSSGSRSSSSGSGSTGSSGTSATSGTTGTPPANDDCGTAATVTAGTPVNGDTRSGNITYTFAANTCATVELKGADVFYKFTAPSASRFEFQVEQATGASFDPAIYLLDNSCPAAGRLASCLIGDDSGSASTINKVRRALTANEEVIVGIGSYSATGAGTFKLTVTDIGPAPANDTCTAPATLTEGTPVSGNTNAATADYKPGTNCGASGTLGPDLVYSFAPSATDTYVVRVGSNPDSGFSPSFYLGTGPCEGSDGGTIACTAAAGTRSDRLGRFALTQGTSYFVYVDSSAATGGDFTLSAERFVAPAGDTCANAVTLTEGTPLTGDNSTATNDYAPGSTCSSSGAISGEVVYSFTPTQTAKYDIKAVGSGGFSPSIYVATNCTTTDGGITINSCVTDSNSSEATVRADLTAGTAYNVFVDGLGGAVGAFTLSADVFVPPTPPANDTCANATALTASTSTSGTLDGATVQYTASGSVTNCSSFTGSDVFYTFTATTAGSYEITTESTNGSDLVLTVLPAGACPANGALTACFASADEEVADPEVLPVTLTANQTITIVVSGYATSASGTFSLSVAPATP